MTTISTTIDQAVAQEETITRFDMHQRLQHIFLMASFTILVLTGIPLEFSGLGLSKWWMSVLGGAAIVHWIHYVAAGVMIGDCFYHAVYLFVNIVIRKKRFPTSIFPHRSDFTLFLQEIAYFAGIRKDKPMFERYNWKEKFDYWAIFWGMPVMVLSGLILMFPVFVAKYLPQWIVPVALVAHGDEAVLALTWIVVVHIFFNHMTPGVFPLNTSIFSGKLPKKKYMSEHPVEYAQITRTKVVEKIEATEESPEHVDPPSE